MIISRTPLRVSFFGGGSDLPAYYRRHGGAVLSTAIDKSVYVTVSRKFDAAVRVSYSRTEEVARAADVEHPRATPSGGAALPAPPPSRPESRHLECSRPRCRLRGRRPVRNERGSARNTRRATHIDPRARAHLRTGRPPRQRRLSTTLRIQRGPQIVLRAP